MTEDEMKQLRTKVMDALKNGTRNEWTIDADGDDAHIILIATGSGNEDDTFALSIELM